MSDNLRRYHAIRNALTQAYPAPPTGNLARHLNTLAALIKQLLGNLSRKGFVLIRGSAYSVTQDTYIFVVFYYGDHSHADPQTALSR